MLTSLARKFSGASSTSPSLLPRMFVENHPSMPSILALRPGATMVLIKVCPVLKSLPQIGTPSRAANSVIAGKSTVMLGAPFANGVPVISAAYA